MYPLNYSFEAGRKKTYQLFHLAEICPKKGKNILYISPILYSCNNTRFQPSPFTFRQNIFHRSQRNFQRRKPIPGHEETKSRLTGALDGAREKPLSLSLSQSRRALERERERGIVCASFADTVVRHLPGGLFALAVLT